MKEIANRICEALIHAEVVDSQYKFSTNWLGKRKSYLGAITGPCIRWISMTAYP